MNEFRILSRDELRDKGQPQTAVLPLPELGEDVAVRVRGFSMGDTFDVRAASVIRSSDGTIESYDEKRDVLLSIVCALVEPKVTLDDTSWVEQLGQGVIEKIIGKAKELGFSTPSAYEDLKSYLRANPYARRVYSLCVNKLGRLPIELADIPEAEFNTMLAALELDAEDEVEAIEQQKSQL